MHNHWYEYKQVAEAWYKNPEWWSAIGSIFVGVVAITIAFLQEIIKRFLSKTKLSVRLKTESPDCHKIKINNSQGVSSYGYYIRSKVLNTGIFSAENVEIMIDSVYKIVDGKRDVVKTFIPMNLVWSHYGSTTMKTILPQHFRHVDIGYFSLSYGEVKFLINTVVQPNEVEDGIFPNILKPGEYEFNLIVGGDNVDSFRKRYSLSFNNNFYKDEESMFSKSIVIKEII